MQDVNVYKLGVKNIAYSILAQGVTFALSIVTGFLLPKILGVTQYGYWQIYLFYVGYIMLFCLGFNDGLYLRYGRLNYNQLPFEKLRSALRVFMLISTALACILFGLSFFEKDPNKVFAFCATSINLLILGLNGTILTILQFTNRIKLNSALTIANKFIFVIIIIPLVIFKQTDFKIIIIADICTKLLLLSINVFKSKGLFIGPAEKLFQGFKEYRKDVRVGIKLMVANIIGTLLIGIGRFIVERYMPLESYSMYSFATTITSFALIFITAASVAMYPLLTRIPEDKLPSLYTSLNILLCSGLFLLLAGYYPLTYLIEHYFSEFTGILEYFYLFFIVIISQGKMQFLINTYYKVLREEKVMLMANASGAIVALILIVPTFYLTHSIYAIVAGTSLALIWRCYASEIYLKNKMGIKEQRNIPAELGMLGIFIIGVILGKSILGFIMYLTAVCIYGCLNRTILYKYTRKIFDIAMNK